MLQYILLNFSFVSIPCVIKSSKVNMKYVAILISTLILLVILRKPVICHPYMFSRLFLNRRISSNKKRRIKKKMAFYYYQVPAVLYNNISYFNFIYAMICHLQVKILDKFFLNSLPFHVTISVISYSFIFISHSLCTVYIRGLYNISGVRRG